jgi:hypothetical protein
MNGMPVSRDIIERFLTSGRAEDLWRQLPGVQRQVRQLPQG